jgi:succinate dehydrogenase/fumarate reductase flavoprotein subunit
VYLSMGHLGPANVRKQFKGMVERCEDCGFDLAGGLVEVVPTAHYMMGGVEFRADGATAIRGLFAAGEDTGGVHGANRLGGNGVANSTVFGAIAGDAMAAWTAREGEWREPAPGAIEEAEARAPCRNRRLGRGPSLQSDMARLVEPGELGRSERGDLHGGRGARGIARRALPRGLPADGARRGPRVFAGPAGRRRP